MVNLFHQHRAHLHGGMCKHGPSFARLRSALALAASMVASAPAGAQALGDLTQLSLEQLTQVEVTSVSRRSEKLVDAAAAVEVLSGDRILRAGANTLPDALRLATGMQVSQLDGREWTISSRGFATVASNKMEVNQDGRSLYGPLFSGVLWDVQATLLDDLDRIEIVRGPGAALWGANAVNGVISIVTKPAQETQGSLVRTTVGTSDRELAVRYGGMAGARSYFRVQAQAVETGGLKLANGADADDERRLLRLGGRWDMLPTGGAVVSLLGGMYRGLIDQVGLPQSVVQGGNLTGRAERKLNEAIDLHLLAYYDHAERRIPLNYSEIRNTGNVEIEAQFQSARNAGVIGARARGSADRIGNGTALSFTPSRSTIRLFSLYGQDQYTLPDERWRITAGSTLENNSYTGTEFQPTVRLAFAGAKSWMLWAAASRAVRTPSRIETDVRFAGPAGTTLLAGSRSFRAEELEAIEAGWRWQREPGFSLDASVFSNRFDDLRSLEPGTGTTFFVNGNRLNAESKGVEVTTTVRPWPAARVILGGRWLDQTRTLDPDSRSPNNGQSEGNDAHAIVTAQFSFDLPRGCMFDTVIRHVSALPSPAVRGYTVADVRLAWRASRAWEVALSGRNLFSAPHAEGAQASAPVELVRPAATISVTWQH